MPITAPVIPNHHKLRIPRPPHLRSYIIWRSSLATKARRSARWSEARSRPYSTRAFWPMPSVLACRDTVSMMI